MHDFVIPELLRAVPYVDYDIVENAGWVSVGERDTAAFATSHPKLVEPHGVRAPSAG